VITKKLRSHLLQCAPHIRSRETGQLLEEALKALEQYRELGNQMAEVLESEYPEEDDRMEIARKWRALDA